jgi:hypothetical protein
MAHLASQEYRNIFDHDRTWIEKGYRISNHLYKHVTIVAASNIWVSSITTGTLRRAHALTRRAGSQ